MTITVKVCKKTMDTMNEFYDDLKRMKTPQYAKFQADDGDTVVTLYESGKAVFQGKDADLASDFWINTEKINSGKVDFTNSEDKSKKDKVSDFDPLVYNSTSIGSDEVGTGDFFGPVVVTSAYVKKEDIKFLESLGVKDSKKLTDEKILEIVPKVCNRVMFQTVIFTDKEYNDRYNASTNMNTIKAILHNKVLGMLKNKVDKYDYIVVDQFAQKFVYYNYLKNEKYVVRDITFMTKAEDKCLSVACASIISRYVFLKQMDKLSKELNMYIPFGASDSVNNTAKEIVKKYGFNKLYEVAKMNFKNVEKIKED